MTNFCAYGTTLPMAYHHALQDLLEYGSVVDCPAWETSCLEISMAMTVLHPLKEPMISRLFPGGWRDLEKYRLEMLDGILDWEVEAGKWAYTYHDRMKDQIPRVVDELRRDANSRRAVINICLPDDMATHDPPCLQNIQYLIRNGKLDCFALFRSNDACKATFMNAFALIKLQERIAKELGVEVGTYQHKANSFHCYAKDIPTLKSYVDRIDTGKNLTYRYKGEWYELMEAERNGILEEVERMKRENKT